MKQIVHDLLASSKHRGDKGYYFDLFMLVLILLNAVAIILQSVPELNDRYGKGFYYFEVFSVIVFTLEYLLRVWSITVDEHYRHPLAGRLRYMMTPMALIDLLAILPFYLPFTGLDLRSLRLLRMFRLFRIFKLGRYVSALNMIHRVFREKREELSISLVFTLFMLLITSTVMYYVENEAQPDVFTSIPQTMWWGIATLTTVGYGDVYPVTGIGKLLGGAIALIGVGLFALPTGILASGFTAEIARRRNHRHCPNCGFDLDQDAAPAAEHDPRN